MFFKMDALKNFLNFTGKKPVLESFPNKVAGLKVCNFIKKSLQRRCFPVKFHKFLGAPFFKEHLRWLFLEGVCKGTSLVKIFRSCHFNVLESITDASERCPLRKIMNKRNCWNFYRFSCFFWILSTVKMKFGQMLVCYMTNISNTFFPKCWRLETSSRLFYDFIKMTI